MKLTTVKTGTYRLKVSMLSLAGGRLEKGAFFSFLGASGLGSWQVMRVKCEIRILIRRYAISVLFPKYIDIDNDEFL